MAVRDTPAAQAQTAPETPSAGPMTLSLDPHVSPEAYAKVREKDRVARVSFTFGESVNATGVDSEFREFLGREHLFITRYDDVIASLIAAYPVREHNVAPRLTETSLLPMAAEAA